MLALPRCEDLKCWSGTKLYQTMLDGSCYFDVPMPEVINRRTALQFALAAESAADAVPDTESTRLTDLCRHRLSRLSCAIKLSDGSWLGICWTTADSRHLACILRQANLVHQQIRTGQRPTGPIQALQGVVER